MIIGLLQVLEFCMKILIQQFGEKVEILTGHMMFVHSCVYSHAWTDMCTH